MSRAGRFLEASCSLLRTRAGWSDLNRQCWACNVQRDEKDTYLFFLCRSNLLCRLLNECWTVWETERLYVPLTKLANHFQTHTETVTENKLPSLTFFMGLMYSKRLQLLREERNIKNFSAVSCFVCRTLGFGVNMGERSSCFPRDAVFPSFAEMQNVCSGDRIS